MSAGAVEAANLVLALLFAAGFGYYCVAGVADRNRTLSRASGLAFLVCCAVAAVFLVRIVR